MVLTSRGPAPAGPLRLLAAGSLKSAFTQIVRDFRERSGRDVQVEYGPAGLLREAILGGAPADVFASANLEHPKAVAKSLGGTPRMFARNALCVIAQPHLEVTSGNLIEVLLDPATRIGISTPKADPSGDYAFALFDKVESVRRGAARTLKAKALQMAGARNAPTRPAHRSAYALTMEEQKVDVFITYRTNALIAKRELPDLGIVPIPQALAVDVDYGIIAIGDQSDAQPLVAFVLSRAAQNILREAGFSVASS